MQCGRPQQQTWRFKKRYGMGTANHNDASERVRNPSIGLDSMCHVTSM
jgi:hypothetical protein